MLHLTYGDVRRSCKPWTCSQNKRKAQTTKTVSVAILFCCHELFDIRFV